MQGELSRAAVLNGPFDRCSKRGCPALLQRESLTYTLSIGFLVTAHLVSRGARQNTIPNNWVTGRDTGHQPLAGIHASSLRMCETS